jgi:hypothetical protein
MTTLFYAYAVQDVRLHEQLEKHLRALKQRGALSDWHSRAVGSDAAWRTEVSPYVAQADVVMLLVSGDFVSHEYCYGPEVNLALERHLRGEVRLIPVLLRPCNWKSTPFGALHPLPQDGKPVSRWRSAEAAFQSIVAGIAPPAPQPVAAAVVAATAAVEPEVAPADEAAVAPAPPAPEPLPSEVALHPEEVGPGYMALSLPGRPAEADAASAKFITMAGAAGVEAPRVAQLVYRAKNARDAQDRLEAGVQAEVTRGGQTEPIPDSESPGAAIRRVRMVGRQEPGAIVLAAKGRFLVAAKVSGGESGATASDDPAELAGSVVNRMLARIPG